MTACLTGTWGHCTVSNTAHLSKLRHIQDMARLWGEGECHNNALLWCKAELARAELDIKGTVRIRACPRFKLHAARGVVPLADREHCSESALHCERASDPCCDGRHVEVCCEEFGARCGLLPRAVLPCRHALPCRWASEPVTHQPQWVAPPEGEWVGGQGRGTPKSVQNIFGARAQFEA